MECDIDVVVSNSFGSSNSSMSVSTVSPEFKDFEGEALPYKWDWEIRKPLPSPMNDAFVPWTLDIAEGETGEHRFQSPRFAIAPVHEVFASPVSM